MTYENLSLFFWYVIFSFAGYAISILLIICLNHLKYLYVTKKISKTKTFIFSWLLAIVEHIIEILTCPLSIIFAIMTFWVHKYLNKQDNKITIAEKNNLMNQLSEIWGEKEYKRGYEKGRALAYYIYKINIDLCGYFDSAESYYQDRYDYGYKFRHSNELFREIDKEIMLKHEHKKYVLGIKNGLADVAKKENINLREIYNKAIAYVPEIKNPSR